MIEVIDTTGSRLTFKADCYEVRDNAVLIKLGMVVVVMYSMFNLVSVRQL